jgi:hypothetical protein
MVVKNQPRTAAGQHFGLENMAARATSHHHWFGISQFSNRQTVLCLGKIKSGLSSAFNALQLP